MKAENYNQLKAIEGLFITFRKVGAVKPSQVDLQTMARVWNEELNRIVNMYCTPCVIEMIEDLYRLLVQHEKTLPDAEIIEEEIEEDIKKVIETEVPKATEEAKAIEQTTAQKAAAAIKGLFGK